ncbi:MAG: chemotaxis protein CheW, partial [Nanobdellota archaeon]
MCALFGRVKDMFKKEEPITQHDNLTKEIEGMSFDVGKPEFRKIVLFTLNDKEYGLDIRKIEEILPSPDYKEMKSADSFVEGMIPLNNQMVGVINLRKKLGYESSVVLSRVLVTRLDGELFGLRVDGVNQVIDVLPSDINEAGDDQLATYCEGFMERGGKQVPVLDITKIVGAEELRNLKQAIESSKQSSAQSSVQPGPAAVGAVGSSQAVEGSAAPDVSSVSSSRQEGNGAEPSGATDSQIADSTVGQVASEAVGEAETPQSGGASGSDQSAGTLADGATGGRPSESASTDTASAEHGEVQPEQEVQASDGVSPVSDGVSPDASPVSDSASPVSD